MAKTASKKVQAPQRNKKSKKSTRPLDYQRPLPKGVPQRYAGKKARKAFEATDVPDGEKLVYVSGGEALLHGFKRGRRIYCSHCDREVSASTFEAHAGFASRKKPYSYIRIAHTGKLLRPFANQLREGGRAVVIHEEHHNACNKDGDLMQCCGCLRSFQIECAQTPRDKWLCASCINAPKRDQNADFNISAQAATVDIGVNPVKQITNHSDQATVDIGVDPLRQISNHSDQIVESKIVQVGETSCCLCRKTDFVNNPFGPLTMILCDQCDREFHIDCLKSHRGTDLEELPKGHWFCAIECQNVHSSLQNLLKKGTRKLLPSVVSHFGIKHVEHNSEVATNFDVSWRLLSGPLCSSEKELKQVLSEAISILEKGFAGCSLTSELVYGETCNQQFRGMHCAVLLVNSKIVSVAVFRLFGQELAELPLITTLYDHRHKGYFHAIFGIICRFCKSHNVKKMILPATDSAFNHWIKLGFEQMEEDQIKEHKKVFPNIVDFGDCTILEKKLSQCQLLDASLENDLALCMK